MADSQTLSPYIDTKLYTMVTLEANQLGNEMYQNLKVKLIKQEEQRCFRSYGYVMKVYEITKYDPAELVSENPNGSSPFRIDYSCRLCVPMVKQQIVCKVENISPLFLILTNGPVYVMVTIDRKNDQLFLVDNDNRLRYRDGESLKLVKPGDFIKLSLESKTFNDGDVKIKAIGFLQEMASEKEIEMFYRDLYHGESGELIEYQEYLKKREMEEKGETEEAAEGEETPEGSDTASTESG